MVPLGTVEQSGVPIVGRASSQNENVPAIVGVHAGPEAVERPATSGIASDAQRRFFAAGLASPPCRNSPAASIPANHS